MAKLRKDLASLETGNYIKSMKLEIGDNVIRILPRNNNIDLLDIPYVEIAMHYGVGPDGISILCSRHIGASCPVCEYIYYLQAHNRVEEAQQIKPITRWIYRVLDLSEDTVKKLIVGPKIHKDILNYLNTPGYESILDVRHGQNVLIKRTGRSQRDTTYNVIVNPSKTPIKETEQKLRLFIKSIPTLDDLIVPMNWDTVEDILFSGCLKPKTWTEWIRERKDGGDGSDSVQVIVQKSKKKQQEEEYEEEQDDEEGINIEQDDEAIEDTIDADQDDTEENLYQYDDSDKKYKVDGERSNRNKYSTLKNLNKNEEVEEEIEEVEEEIEEEEIKVKKFRDKTQSYDQPSSDKTKQKTNKSMGDFFSNMMSKKQEEVPGKKKTNYKTPFSPPF